METDEKPFADLPAALVEELLGKTGDIGRMLLGAFDKVRTDRASLRQALADRGLLLNESSLGYPPLPTTCGADGSYAIERLLTVDLVAAAAVAVEGLTPPSEKRHWGQPHHSTFVAAEPHHAETATVARAVMLGRELLLAAQAPHEVVMVDMTLTLPVIYFNQALNAAPGVASLQCSAELFRECCAYLEAYQTILCAERSDKQYVGLPKYSTRREVGRQAKWASTQDDRALLTLLLQPGELTKPLALEKPAQDWHLNVAHLPHDVHRAAKSLAEETVARLKDIYVLYYKPQEWLPALRLEVGQNIAMNHHRLATVIQGLKHQCATAAMFEPYPLYLADRTVKALARAVPAFRQVTTQRISENYDGDIGEVFFAMHGYRSESGG